LQATFDDANSQVDKYNSLFKSNDPPKTNNEKITTTSTTGSNKVDGSGNKLQGQNNIVSG